MTEPLDFSSAGRKKPRSPAKEARKRPAVGRRRAIALTAAIVVALLTGVAYVVSDLGDTTDAVSSAEARARYCELSRRFDATASNTGASVSPAQLDGPPEAISRLEAQMKPVLDELESTAPEEVRTDVAAVVDALRKAGSGDVQAARSGRVSAAIKKMTTFEQTSCPVGGSSGDG